MTRTEIEEVLLEIIADIDEEADFDALDPDKPLRDQLELDSMDFLDIVMELRKRYKLQGNQFNLWLKIIVKIFVNFAKNLREVCD